ncbi:MAG TPA: acyltransferase [Micavibrio sp.]|nr:acyltransferase [Micavibrio sp.]
MKEQDAPLPPEGTPHAHYMRPLDGLRGIACLLVVASHIAAILNLNFKEDIYNIGSMGVVIFFALSGFLMSMLYSDKRFSLDASAKYVIARMSRIAPAYWVAIAFVWILYLILPSGYHYDMTPLAMLRSVFFMGNVGVFWSIPPEIQFYGFFLLLWFSYEKLKGGNFWWAAAVALLCLGFIATRDLWGGLILPSKIHIFLSGFLVAFMVKYEKIRRYLCHPAMQAALVAGAMLYAVYGLERHKIYDDLIITALIALSIGSLSRSTPFSASLETQSMRLMGAASFSIYLFHDAILQAIHTLGLINPAYETFNIIVMCLISIAIPVAFHVLAEKRLTVLARKKGMLAFERVSNRWPLKKLVPAGN